MFQQQQQQKYNKDKIQNITKTQIKQNKITRIDFFPRITPFSSNCRVVFL